MNRRDTLVRIGALSAAGWLPASFAQGSGKVWRVGAVAAGNDAASTPLLDAFVAAMGEHGYRVGQNLILDVRYARGDPTRYLPLAEELIALKPDVLLGTGAGVALAMKGRTATIPIVMCTVSDAVGTGLVQSLARPGGNVTGLSMQLHELGAKHVEFMSELLPQARSVALFTDATQPWALSESYERLAKTAAAAKKVAVNVHRIGAPDELRRAFRFLEMEKADALLSNPSPRFNSLRSEIIKGAAALRLPTIVWTDELAESGALASYGPSFSHAYRRVAYFVDRIFKGARPADLPIEQPTKFSLAINKRTAAALGLRIPQSVLLRVDRVIE
jgi:putative tryptophan/tyrosine transport system substrate-binding protein